MEVCRDIVDPLTDGVLFLFCFFARYFNICRMFVWRWVGLGRGLVC